MKTFTTVTSRLLFWMEFHVDNKLIEGGGPWLRRDWSFLRLLGRQPGGLGRPIPGRDKAHGVHLLLRRVKLLAT